MSLRLNWFQRVGGIFLGHRARGNPFSFLKHKSMKVVFQFQCCSKSLWVQIYLSLYRNELIKEESIQATNQEPSIENWTKWRIFLKSASHETITLYPNMQLSISNMVQKNLNWIYSFIDSKFKTAWNSELFSHDFLEIVENENILDSQQSWQ